MKRNDLIYLGKLKNPALKEIKLQQNPNINKIRTRDQMKECRDVSEIDCLLCKVYCSVVGIEL